MLGADRRRRRPRPAQPGARARDRRRRAAPRRPGARLGRPRPRAAARAPGRRAAATPSQTRGNLLAALLKSPAAIGVIRGVGAAGEPRPQPGRPDARDDRRMTGNARLGRRAHGPGVDRARRRALLGRAGRVRPHRCARSPSALSLRSIIDVRTGRETDPVADLGLGARLGLRGRPARTGRACPVHGRPALTANSSLGLQRFDAGSGVPIGPSRSVFTGEPPATPSSIPRCSPRATAGVCVERPRPRRGPRREHAWPCCARSTTPRSGTRRPQPRRPRCCSGPHGRPRSTSLDLDSGALRRARGRHQGAVLQLGLQRATGAPPRAPAATTGSCCGTSAAGRSARRSSATPARSPGWPSALTGARSTAAASTARSCSGTSPASAGSAAPFALPRKAVGHALSPDRRTLAVAHADGTVTLVDVAAAADALAAGRRRGCRGVAFLRDGRLLATFRRRGRRGYGVVVDPRSGAARVAPPRTRLVAGRRASPRRRAALVRRGAALVQPLGRPSGRSRALLPALRRHAERRAQPRRPQTSPSRRGRASRSSTSPGCGSARS